MKRIVCSIQPFVMKQMVMVYNEEGKLDKTIPSTIGNLPTTIWEACKTNHIDNVDLAGSRIFTGRVQKELIKISKFAKIDLTINIH